MYNYIAIYREAHGNLSAFYKKVSLQTLKYLMCCTLSHCFELCGTNTFKIYLFLMQVINYLFFSLYNVQLFS